MPGPWGAGPWGMGPWGAGTPLTVRRVYASSTHTVVVELSREPRHVTVLGFGDALRPATWIVESITTAMPFIVVACRVFGDGTKVELYLQRALEGFLNVLRVKSDDLVAPDGSPIGLPNFGLFRGVTLAPRALPDAKAKDLRSPPFEDRGILFTAAGDYALQDGVELLQKLILRRLTTAPGGFFHLPDYGIGLQVKVGITPNDLVNLRREVERQVLLEPDVEAAVARATLTRDGRLDLTVRVRLRASQREVLVPIPVQPPGVAL